MFNPDFYLGLAFVVAMCGGLLTLTMILRSRAGYAFLRLFWLGVIYAPMQMAGGIMGFAVCLAFVFNMAA